MAKKKPEINERSILAIGRLPATDEEEIIRLAKTVYEQVSAEERTKWPRGLQSFENFSFFLGNHFTTYYYMTDGFGFHANGRPDSNHFDRMIAQIADNRLIAPVERVAAMLTSTKPMPRTVANSIDPLDEDAAALSDLVIQLFFEKPMNMPHLLREMALLGSIAGTCAIETTYGEVDVPIETMEEGPLEEADNPLYNPRDPDSPKTIQRPTLKAKTAYKKDIQAKLWSSYHLIPDPQATSAEDMTWIARQTYEDIDSVLDRWVRDEEGHLYSPKDRERIRNMVGEESGSRSVLYWWYKIQDIIETPQHAQQGGGSAPSSPGAQNPSNQTKLTIVDHKPTPEYPRGRTLVLAGTKLLFVGDSRSWSEKYPWRWHPYAFWGWQKVPGRFWHLPLLSELVPLQKRINSIDALVQANRQYMSIGQWLIPKHTKVPEGWFGGRPAQQTTYVDLPGHAKPERVRHEPLPAELLMERQELIRAIEVISASGLLMDQLAKSSVRSGSMMDFLKQEQLRNKSPMLHEFERMLEVVAQNVLIEIQNNLTEDDPELTTRIRTAARDHSSLSISTFVGSDLRDHHSVKIDISTELLHTPEARQAKALEALQYGAQQMTPLQINAVFSALGLDEFMDDATNMTVERVERLIGFARAGQVRIAEGKGITDLAMRGIDDAAVAAEVCRKAIMQDTFRDLEPDVQSAIIQLFDLYKGWVQEEAQQALENQIQMTQLLGAGSEPGPNR